MKSTFSNLPPPKTACAAALFFITGLSFLIAGAVLFWGGTHQKDKGFTFLILGGISNQLFLYFISLFYLIIYFIFNC